MTIDQVVAAAALPAELIDEHVIGYVDDIVHSPEPDEGPPRPTTQTAEMPALGRQNSMLTR